MKNICIRRVPCKIFKTKTNKRTYYRYDVLVRRNILQTTGDSLVPGEYQSQTEHMCLFLLEKWILNSSNGFFLSQVKYGKHVGLDKFGGIGIRGNYLFACLYKERSVHLYDTRPHEMHRKELQIAVCL